MEIAMIVPVSGGKANRCLTSLRNQITPDRFWGVHQTTAPPVSGGALFLAWFLP